MGHHQGPQKLLEAALPRTPWESWKATLQGVLSASYRAVCPGLHSDWPLDPSAQRYFLSNYEAEATNKHFVQAHVL